MALQLLKSYIKSKTNGCLVLIRLSLLLKQTEFHFAQILLTLGKKRVVVADA